MYRDAFEREEDLLCEQVNDGTISQSEFNEAMRDLRRDHQSMAEEAAQRAYDDEMGNW